MIRSLYYSTISALAISMAWWFPGGWECALMGWISVCFLVLLTWRESSVYLAAWGGGMILNTLGFYWLPATIANYGGFPNAAAVAIFMFFVGVSALQFPLAILVYKRLPSTFDEMGIRVATAFTVVEFLAVRIFPWQYAHTQLGFTYFAQAADIAGTPLLTFMMFWFCESVLTFAVRRQRGLYCLIPVTALSAMVSYSAGMVRVFENPVGISQRVILVQGNIPIGKRNTGKHVALTKKLAQPGDLVIWPESSILEWVPVNIGSITRDIEGVLPRLDKGISLLAGSLSLESSARYFNSALAIYGDGTIPVPYHKQILMPFGEYTPFSGMFPILKEMNPSAGDFSSGTDVTVFDFPSKSADGTPYTIKAAPLICYEDVIPGLALRAVEKGAQLLVNMTNDAWFGNTAAPYQHQLIAAFRAIENRRFLVRATNTGLSSVISPLGRVVNSLPLFQDGTLLAKVQLMRYKSPYTKVLGNMPIWVLTVLCGTGILANFLFPQTGIRSSGKWRRLR